MGMKPVGGSIAAVSAVFWCDAEGKGFRMKKGKEKQGLLQILSHVRVVCLEWLEDYLGWT